MTPLRTILDDFGITPDLLKAACIVCLPFAGMWIWKVMQ